MGNITINNNQCYNVTGIVQSKKEANADDENLTVPIQVKADSSMTLIDEATRAELIKYGYSCKQVIGRGGFGLVYLCSRLKATKQNKEWYAVKV